MHRSRQVGEGEAQADVEEHGAQDHARHQQACHTLHDACAPARKARSSMRAAGTSTQQAFLLRDACSPTSTPCAPQAGLGRDR